MPRNTLTTLPPLPLSLPPSHPSACVIIKRLKLLSYTCEWEKIKCSFWKALRERDKKKNNGSARQNGLPDNAIWKAQRKTSPRAAWQWRDKVFSTVSGSLYRKAFTVWATFTLAGPTALASRVPTPFLSSAVDNRNVSAMWPRLENVQTGIPTLCEEILRHRWRRAGFLFFSWKKDKYIRGDSV